MSRTKNRGFQQSFSPSYTIRRWRLGEYIRLSKEDLKRERTIATASSTSVICSMIFTKSTLKNLKAFLNMWTMDTQERMPTAKISSGFWPM